MSEAAQYNNEIEVLVQGWYLRTIRAHKITLGKLKVGDTQGLEDSLKHEMRSMANGYLQGEMSFLERGRFVDMGSGRGYSFGKRAGDQRYETTETSKRGRITGRRAKKWYGKVYYGRLNDLQGAIGYKMMEQCVDVVRRGVLGIV